MLFGRSTYKFDDVFAASTLQNMPEECLVFDHWLKNYSKSPLFSCISPSLLLCYGFQSAVAFPGQFLVDVLQPLVPDDSATAIASICPGEENGDAAALALAAEALMNLHPW